MVQTQKYVIASNCATYVIFHNASSGESGFEGRFRLLFHSIFKSSFYERRFVVQW